MAHEAKIIKKKLKEAKRLEKIEVQVLGKLRGTYAKQQDAVERIKEIFSERERFNKEDPDAEILV
tara:strand:- start:102 stop:296 length:195 start_codon:yes stop_codon:yes gene_type:complete